MATFEDVVNKAKSAGGNRGEKDLGFFGGRPAEKVAAETEKELSYTMEGLGRLLYDGKKTGEDRSSQGGRFPPCRTSCMRG